MDAAFITFLKPLRFFIYQVHPGEIWTLRRMEGDPGMKFFPRGLTIGVLLLILFTSACNLPAQSPTAVGTILPTGQTPTTIAPTLPVSTETPMTFIPVTGSQEVILQCQFCVNDEPHAVLILPESAAFLVSEPVIGVNCITAQVVSDSRILFCRGAQQTIFTLNVCFDGVNCLQYPITLETCPLSQQAANPTPVVLVASNQGITPTAPAATETSVPPPTLAATTAAPPTATATLPPPVAATTAPALPLPTQTVPPAIATTDNAQPPSVLQRS